MTTEKTPSTLQQQAWKRAKENKKPRTGYPWDWLDYEDIKKEEEDKENEETTTTKSKETK